MQVDASIPGQAFQDKTPSLTESVTQSMSLGKMQREAEATRNDARENAKMSQVLNNLDPTDPGYDDKALKALHEAGVSSQKILSLKTSFLEQQKKQADVDLAKANAKEKQQDFLDKADKHQIDTLKHSNELVGMVSNDVVQAYDTNVAKGNKAAGIAAAETLWKGHLKAVTEDPTIPDSYKAVVAQLQKKPFTIESVRTMYHESEEWKTMIADQDKKLAQQKTQAEIGHIGAQTQEAKAGVAEKMAATEHFKAETGKVKEETAQLKSGGVAATGDAKKDQDFQAALAERQGLTKLTGKQQATQNQVANALFRKYPDASPDDIAEMVVHGKASASGQAAEARVVGAQNAKIGLGAKEINDKGGLADQTRSAAAKVDMGRFKKLNDIESWAASHVNDTDVITLNNKLQATKNAAIQVMQRGGASTEGANERVDHIINTNMGSKGINAALDALQDEIATVQKAGKEQMNEIGKREKVEAPAAAVANDPLGLR